MADDRLVRLLKLGADEWNEIRAQLRETSFSNDIVVTLQPEGEEPFELRGSDMWHPDLSRADLRGLDLDGADLRNAVLRFADLTDCSLRSTNLRKANLFRATVHGVVCVATSFEGADLVRADFTGSTFVQPHPDYDMDVTSLAKARIRETMLDVSGLDDVVMAEALASAGTVFPAGFDARAAGVVFEDDPDGDEPGAFTARVERLDETARRDVYSDLEPLLTQAQRLLEDGDLDDEAELRLRAAIGTAREELRSLDPDVVIIERATARLIGLVAGHLDAEVLAEAVGIADDAAKTEFAEAFDDLVASAGQVGIENAAADVEQANDAADRYEDVLANRGLGGAGDDDTQSDRKRLSGWLAEQRRRLIVGAVEGLGAAAAVGAVSHPNVVLRLAIEGYQAIASAVEGLLRLFV